MNTSTNNETILTDLKVNRSILPVIISSSAMLLAGLASFIGNCLIVTVILKYKQMRMSLDAIYMILYLAIADGLCGLGSIIATSDRFRLLITMASFNRGKCLAASGVLLFGFAASQIMIGFVALDRLSAVLDPMGYRIRNHYKFATICFMISVMYGAVHMGALFGGDLGAVPAVCNAAASFTKGYQIYWLVFTFVIAAVVILLYTAVLLVMSRKLKAIGPGTSAAAIQLKRQAKVTKVISFVLLAYICCWVVPNTAFNTGLMLGVPGSVLGILGPCCAVLIVSSGAINILVYSLKMPEFKKYLVQFFKGHTTTATVAPIGSVNRSTQQRSTQQRSTQQRKGPRTKTS